MRRTRSFLSADIGSVHYLLMITSQVRLKETRKTTQPRLRFHREKFKNPDVDMHVPSNNRREICTIHQSEG